MSEVRMHQSFSRSHMVSSWLLLIVCAVFIGLLVAVLSYLLMGHQAFHLPGGSLSAGFTAAMTYPNKQLKPMWLRIVVGAVAGVLGWVLFAMSYAY